METDNDYDAALDYIDWDNLAEYSETMGLFREVAGAMGQGVRDLAPGGAAYGNKSEGGHTKLNRSDRERRKTNDLMPQPLLPDDCWLEEERWMQLRNYKPKKTMHKLKAGTCAKADLDYNRSEVYSSSFASPAMAKIIKAQRANEDDPNVDGVEVLSQDHVFRVYPDSMSKDVLMTNQNYNPYVAPAVVPPWQPASL